MKARSVPNILIVDLDDDTKMEVVAADAGGTINNEFNRIHVIDSETGESRWTRIFPERERQVVSSGTKYHFIAGPDINNDGVREVFAVSNRFDTRPKDAALRHPSYFSIYIDAFDGRNGASLWWLRYPLPGLRDSVTRRSVNGRSVDADCSGLVWGTVNANGFPNLLIPIRHCQFGDTKIDHTLLVVDISKGQIVSTGQEIQRPITADFDQDGLADTAYFVRDGGAVLDTSTYHNAVPGKLHVSKGLPPIQWQRFGKWVPTVDINGDGLVDLRSVNSEKKGPLTLISGKSGEVLSRTDVRWKSQAQSEFHSDKWIVLPKRIGDLDHDGTADLIAVETSNKWSEITRGGGLRKVATDTISSIPIRLLAHSGKTQKELWQSETMPIQFSTEHPQNQLTPFSVVACDIERDHEPTLLCLADFFGNDGKRFSEEYFLCRFSGIGGKLVWSQSIYKLVESKPRNAWYPTSDAIITECSSDFDLDNVRDVIIVAPRPTPNGVASELQVRSGKNGNLLWPPLELAQAATTNISPVVSDVDGDGAHEILLLDRVQGVDLNSMIVIDGNNGNEKWRHQWNGKDKPSMVIADILSENRLPAIGLNYEKTNSGTEFLFLDGHGKNVGTIPAILCWAHDLDGDSKRELLYLDHGPTLHCVRNKSEGDSWKWTSRDSKGIRVEIQPASPDSIGSVLVWQGHSVTALNAISGIPILRSHHNSLLGSKSISRPYVSNNPSSQAQIVTHSQDLTIALPMLATQADGHYAPMDSTQSSTPLVHIGKQSQFDPRLLRRLPWAFPPNDPFPNISRALGILTFIGLISLYSVCFLVIPGWIFWRTFRARQYSLRGMLACFFAIVLSFASYQTLAVIVSGSVGGESISLLQLAISLSVFGLPIVAFNSFLYVWFSQRQWRRIIAFVAMSVFIASLTAITTLWFDRNSMHLGERYDLEDWYVVVLKCGYFTTTLWIAFRCMVYGLTAWKSMLPRLFAKWDSPNRC
ncbi:MAG: hypothetical protein ABL921_05395 [Pirellula sp.]